jgi:hypothetical protein
MRILLTIPVLLLAAACNVSKDGNAVTVQYDQNLAENTAADVSNTAQNVGGAIANDVQEETDRAQNTDVDLDVNANVDVDRNNQ